MSPEAGASAAALATLRREIQHDWTTATAVADDLAQFVTALQQSPLDRLLASHVALQLHHFYSSIEMLIERIAAVIDQSVPRGDRAHQRLLEQAAVEIPGLRIAVISQPTFEGLDALRKFRHFVRHAYVLQYDQKRLEDNLARLVAIRSTLRADIERFDAFLVAAIASVTQS